jgi:hypothetical protein
MAKAISGIDPINHISKWLLSMHGRGGRNGFGRPDNGHMRYTHLQGRSQSEPAPKPAATPWVCLPYQLVILSGGRRVPAAAAASYRSSAQAHPIRKAHLARRALPRATISSCTPPPRPLLHLHRAQRVLQVTIANLLDGHGHPICSMAMGEEFMKGPRWILWLFN